MIKIRIGNEERDFASVDEHWINQQINGRRADGQIVCVMVTIQEGDLNMVLSTPTCEYSGGGSRHPNPHEKEIFDLWEKRGLKDTNFTGGNLVAFLKQFRRFV